MLLLCPWNPFLSLLLSWAGRGRSLSGDAIGLSKPIIGKGMAIPIQCEWWSGGRVTRNWYKPCLYIININFQVSVLLHHIPNSLSGDHGRHFEPSIRGLLVVHGQRVFEQLVLRRSPFRALALVVQTPIRGQNFSFPLHHVPIYHAPTNSETNQLSQTPQK